MGKRKKRWWNNQTPAGDKGDNEWRRTGSVWAKTGAEGYASSRWDDDKDNDTSGYGAGYNTRQYKFWMVKPKLVFTAGKASIWGGKAEDMRYSPFKLLVVLEGAANLYRPALKMELSPEAEKLFQPEALKVLVQPSCPWVSLHWPDYGVPKFTQQWWQTFVAQISQIEGPVGFCCHGGIGRTGTALSIVAALSGHVEDSECPVAYVRAHYIDDAVESDEQLTYVEKITGIRVMSTVMGYYPYHTPAHTTGATTIAPPGAKLPPLPNETGVAIPKGCAATTGVFKSAAESAKVFQDRTYKPEGR